MKTNRYLKLAFIILILPLLYQSCREDSPESEFDLNTFEGVIDAGGTYEEVMSSKEETVVGEDIDSLIQGEPWVCTTRRVSLTEGASDQPLFNPNAGVIWPGNLLQGASLNAATPSVISGRRAGGTISYDLNNGNLKSSFTVDEITKGNIQDAMNNIISGAPELVPAHFSFTYEEVQSRQHLAVALGVDVNTRFTHVESDFSFSNDRQYSRYLVKLNQQYYTMSINHFNSPEEIFHSSVTPASQGSGRTGESGDLYFRRRIRQNFLHAH